MSKTSRARRSCVPPPTTTLCLPAALPTPLTAVGHPRRRASLTETNCQIFQDSPKQRGQFVQNASGGTGATQRRPLHSTRGAAPHGARLAQKTQRQTRGATQIGACARGCCNRVQDECARGPPQLLQLRSPDAAARHAPHAAPEDACSTPSPATVANSVLSDGRCAPTCPAQVRCSCCHA